MDQGEELYARASKDEAKLFSRLLKDAPCYAPFSVFMSLRSDFYTEFQNDRDLIDVSERFDVLPLRHDGLIEIIRKPAAVLGVRFENDEMAERIAEATELEPGALPLLSDLMHEFWRTMLERGDGELRWSAVPEIVDISAPLKQRAEAFLGTSWTDKDILKRLPFLAMTHADKRGAALEEIVRRLFTLTWCTSTCRRAGSSSGVQDQLH